VGKKKSLIITVIIASKVKTSCHRQGSVVIAVVAIIIDTAINTRKK
jgi:hypothetical protein